MEMHFLLQSHHLSPLMLTPRAREFNAIPLLKHLQITFIKLQSAGNGGRKPRYSSASEAYRKILAEEGLRDGLYRGYFPNLIRNSVISATELVSSPSIACLRPEE